LKLDIPFADLGLALGKFLRSSDRDETLQAIQDYWGSERPIVITLAERTAFDLLLQSLQLPPGSEVLISAVNIWQFMGRDPNRLINSLTRGFTARIAVNL
jgi:perosamine synthetase